MWRCMRRFFFFQAEDGIRDLTVTGVQTCALPISVGAAAKSPATGAAVGAGAGLLGGAAIGGGKAQGAGTTSGEGRGGEEGRYRGGPGHLKKKKKDTIQELGVLMRSLLNDMSTHVA